MPAIPMVSKDPFNPQYTLTIEDQDKTYNWSAVVATDMNILPSLGNHNCPTTEILTPITSLIEMAGVHFFEKNSSNACICQVDPLS